MAQDYERRKQEYLEEEERREAEYLAELARKEELEKEQQRQRRESYLRETAKRELKERARREVTKRLFRFGGRGAVGAGGAGGAGAAGGGVAGAAAVATSPIWATIGIILLIIVLIVGIILLATITLFAICNAEGWTGKLAQFGSAAVALVGITDQDYCKAFQGYGGVVDFAKKVQGPFCADPAALEGLAETNRVPYPAQNDPDLDKLIACIRGRVSYSGAVYTYDETHETCNYTRGVPACDESCSHAVFSCHYGGQTPPSGTDGSLAVDYPVAGPQGAAVLQAASSCSASLGIPLKRATCEKAKEGTAVYCSDPFANHVHISIKECDKDNGPINTQ